MTASSGKRQDRQSHAGQGGKRDFQAQFRDTTDAVRPRRTTDTATETVTSSDQSVQVELPKIPARIPADQRKPLSLFLRSVEGLVSDQLQRNLRSRAGNDFKVEWQSLSENAELVSNFPRKVFNDLPTLAVQWNSTGTLLAMAFGRTDHDAFCVHKSGICIWKIFLGKPTAEPEHVLNMDTCVSGIAFHPKKERLLAAAGANGEIFVWDLALATDNLVADSGLKTFGGHSEPITALRWITATPNSRTFLILTAGLDGRLIMWANNVSKTTPNRSTVTPSKQMTIVQTTASVLKNSWSDGLISASVMGVTSVNTSVSSCLFGTDTGGIGRCRFSDFKDLRAVVIDSAVTLNYEQHNGPVTGIARSHFSDQCFATVSSDGKLKLFRNADVRNCCDWSPFRPYVIIVGTSNGNLLFFDFYAKRQRTKPAKMVKIFEGAEILSVQFNNRDSSIVAVGGADGVQLWKIPEIFSTEMDDERQSLSGFLRGESSAGN